jgi:carbon-monoxide dehydrogenase medium subunit
MKPAPLDYRRPESLEEALDLLRRHGDEAKVLAGGQSLVPLLNMRLARPRVLVDVNAVTGLDRIDVNGGVRIGALVRQRALEESKLAPPLVAEALPHVGHFVTRNRGTIAGSIAHADPAAELPLCLVVLGGSVVARSVRGDREIPADEFFVTHFTTRLEPDELVIETLWPSQLSGWGFAFEELAQRRGDYALSMAACALRVEGGRVAEVRVGIGSVVDRPTLLEPGLAGARVTPDLAREARQQVATAIASSAYLRHLTGVLVERALLRAWRNAA